jgi:methionine biosynthesis protein MetW
MPVSKELPYQWYETPNIHLCTVNDFRDLCRREGLRIEREAYLNRFDRPARGLRLPNFTARIAVFAVARSGPAPAG